MKSLQAAIRALPATVVVNGDTSPAQREVAELRARLEALSNKTVGIDLSAAQAKAEVASIRADLDRLGAKSVDIGVGVDTGAASAALGAFNAEVDRVDGRTARAQVDVDSAGALGGIAAARAALAEFDGKKATANLDIDATGAIASIAKVAALVTAFGGLGGALGGVAGGLVGVGAAGVVAGGGLGTAMLAGLGVGKALSAMSAQQDSAAATARQSAQQQAQAAYQVESAQLRLQQASQKAGQARSDAARNVARAEQEAATQSAQAQQNVSRAVSAATKARQDAARSVAAAEKAAADSVSAAQDQVISASRRYQSATRASEQAQRQLTSAWEAGRRSLQDLQDQLDMSLIDQRQAALDLKDAKKQLAEAQASGDADAIERAQIAYARQVETVDQLGKRTARLGVDNAKAQKAGVAGTDQYVSALERAKGAEEAQTDAGIALANARANVRAAEADGAQRIADAQRQGAEQIQAADQRVSDARAALALADMQGAQRVADAREQGARQVAAADQAVMEAQRALQQAMSQTGTAGQAAADKVAQAFANLSPAAADFARFLFGLKPTLESLSATAAAGLFPPLQQGISTLLTQLPLIKTVVGQMAAGLGAGLKLVLEQLASPFWTNFFRQLGEASGTLIPGFFGALMSLAQAAAMLVQAFLPLAPAGFAIVQQLAGLVGYLAPFLAQLLGALIPTASLFIQALYPLGPLLAALAPILAALGTLVSQVLGALLTALTPVVVALTPLFQQLAAAIGTWLVGAIQAVTPFLVAVATWMSQNPGMVLGMAAAIAGLALAFQGLMGAVGIITSIGGAITAWSAISPILAAIGPLLRGLGPAISAIGRAVLGAMGPVGWIIMAFGLMYASSAPFRDAINGVLQILMQLVGQIVGAVMPIFTVLGNVIQMLAGIFGQLVQQLAVALVPVINLLAGVLQQLVGALLPPLMQIVGALVPVIALLGQVFGQVLMAVLGPVIGAITQLVGAILPPLVMILQTVIIPLITMLANLFAGVLSFVITNVLIPAIQFLIPIITWLANLIATVLTWAITNAVVPALNLLVPLFQWIGTAAMWLWTNALQPAFQAIGTFISWVWTTLIKPALDVMVWTWQNIIAPAAMWLWTTIIQPIFQAIGAFIGFVWTYLIKPAFDALVWVITNIIVPCVTWLWINIIQPIFSALGAFIAFVWTNIIKPAWDALVWVIQNIITPAVMWLWNNVIKPAFEGIGAVISWVWNNIIRPAFDAVKLGLQWLGEKFDQVTNWIGDIWNKIRGFLAKPINFMINTVWNQGIVPAWNKVAGLVGLGEVQPLAPIPEAATGGLLRGPGSGTSDSILGVGPKGTPTARVSNGEFVVRESVTRRTLPFLSALNAGEGEALQAAGGLSRVAPKKYRGRSGFDMNVPRPHALGGLVGLPGFAAGGPFQARIDEAKKWLSGPARGAPYVYGGGTNPRTGMDCSSMQSAVTHILSGRPPDSGRIGTTASMPWGGFAPGLTSDYAIGNKPADHMAGTLQGQNVEQHGPDGTPFSFPSRWGADNGYFTQHWSLPVVGGQFVSGGEGGGFFNWIRPLIEEAFNTLTDPGIAALDALVPDPPPEWNRVPVALATKIRDSLRDFLFTKSDEQTGDMGAMPAGTGPVADQVRAVARAYGWDAGPQWDAINWIIGKESSWNPTIKNATSSAKGLFQIIDGTWAGLGVPGDRNNPGIQAQAGLKYIKQTYGDPIGAKSFHMSHGWYDQGGIARGKGIMFKDVIADERVLDPQETQAYDRLGTLVDQIESGRLRVPGMSNTDVLSAQAGRGPSGPLIQMHDTVIQDPVDVDMFGQRIGFLTGNATL